MIATVGPAATFEIRIPHAAPRVEILVNGQRRFLKEASRVTTRGSAESRDAYRLALTAGR